MTNTEIAIDIASTLTEKELQALVRISKSRFCRAASDKHKTQGRDIRRRNTKKEKKAGKSFSMMSVLSLAIVIKKNGNLIIEDKEELEFARDTTIRIMSTYLGRVFTLKEVKEDDDNGNSKN